MIVLVVNDRMAVRLRFQSRQHREVAVSAMVVGNVTRAIARRLRLAESGGQQGSFVELPDDGFLCAYRMIQADYVVVSLLPMEGLDRLQALSILHRDLERITRLIQKLATSEADLLRLHHKVLYCPLMID